MSEYLYVCHFSNGHIKVGRSVNPASRVASRADRVACMDMTAAFMPQAQKQAEKSGSLPE